ncbi:proteasome subunit beta type-7-like [Artemia franciscana]|uniref:Proteasome subunit beta n=1 Tax=Artemia franciscana TaxID=6661 RepID=A0AA88I6Q3_ARTSF|nr:hypothetical protein QYM36_003548 [Artemia franciscana]
MTEGGFSFENCRRNALLEKQGYVAPRAFKTGTTICGVVVKDAVILGADTRSTAGSIVADKVCEKTHYIAPHIRAVGAGTAADLQMVTRMVESNMNLLKMQMNRQVPVVACIRMLKQYLFQYQGYVGAYLIVGGIDSTGPQLYSVSAHGNSDKTPFLAMGSGSISAMSILESRWKPDLTAEEGMKLVRDAIASGIFNDLGSGSNVDLWVITKEGEKYHQPYDEANKKGTRENKYLYKAGTTAVLKSKVIPYEIVAEEVKHMETV